jgi:hypothetical protein
MQWKSCVPDILVVHLTSSYFKSPLIKGISFSQGFLHSDNLVEDIKLNNSLDRSAFQEGCGAWLDLMRRHPKSKVKACVAPWNTLLKEHLYSPVPGLEGWEVERAYLNLLRSAAKPVGDALPSWDYEELWTRARQMAMEARHMASELKMKAMLESLPYQIFPAQPSFSKSSSSTQPFRGRADPQRNVNSKPDFSSRDRAHDPESPKFCFACGSRTHISKVCNEDKQENGRPINIIRNTRGTWTLQSGASICYHFNGTVLGGCSNKDCPRGKHVCTRCLASTHGARQCPEA